MSANTDEQKPEKNKTAEPAAVETPKDSNEAAQTSNSKTVNVMAGIILLLLAIVVGGALYTMTKDDSPDDTTASSQSSQKESDEGSDAESTAKPSTKALRTGILAESTPFIASLDAVKVNANSVRVNFTIKCTDEEKDSNVNDCWTGALYRDKYALAKAYIVDDDAQQKYEVIKDANGEPLVTDVDTQWLADGEIARYFVNFTKPPKDSNVTIYLYGISPISDIKITK